MCVCCFKVLTLVYLWYIFTTAQQEGGAPSLIDSCDTVSEEEKQLSSIDSTIR